MLGARVLTHLESTSNQNSAADLESIARALELFRGERGFYVVSDKHPVAVDHLNPRYLPRIIRVDPWHQPYKYDGQRDHFTLRSSGPDGKDNTADDIRIASPVLINWRWSLVGDAFGTRLVINSKGKLAINNLGQWDGNSWDNMATMRNIVMSYSSDHDAAYAYGPSPNSARDRYAKEVTARTPTYKNFFNCLLGKE